MSSARLRLGAGAGRAYFAVQALAGAAWWIAVFLSDAVRAATLGDLDVVLVAVLDIPLFVVGSAVVALGVRLAVWAVVPWTALVTAGMTVYATVTGLAGWGALLMIVATAASLPAASLVLFGRLRAEWLFAGPFAFRLAPPASRPGYVGRTAVQIVAFWGLFLIVLPLVIAWVERRWGLEIELPAAVRIAGIVLLAASSALGLWSAYAMSMRGEGTPLPAAMAARLVTSGPYRLIRNPMAVAGIVQGVAVGLILSSWLVMLYALAGSLVWNWLVRPGEEANLEARFGTEFIAYRDAVPCWVPRLSRP